MHGQNINLYVCVCVSVCPSHFLSTHLQVRPLNGFLQLITYQTRIYARMSFWGYRWWIITLRGPEYPQNSHFGSLSRHFKPNMRKSQIAISSDLYQIDMKFDRQLRPATDTSYVVSYDGKTISRWRTAAILKIDISSYLSKNYPTIMKFCARQQILNWMNVMWSKMKKLHWTDSEFDSTHVLFGKGIVTTTLC